MRKVLIGIGLVAVVIVTLVMCVWLRSTRGDVAVFALATFSGMAAWVANAVAKAIAQDAFLAVRSLGLSLKEAAAIVDMDIAQASRQLTGVQRLDYAAWSELEGWEAAFASFRAKRHGTFTVHENGVVAQALALLTRIVDGHREVAA